MFVNSLRMKMESFPTGREHRDSFPSQVLTLLSTAANRKQLGYLEQQTGILHFRLTRMFWEMTAYAMHNAHCTAILRLVRTIMARSRLREMNGLRRFITISFPKRRTAHRIFIPTVENCLRKGAKMMCAATKTR